MKQNENNKSQKYLAAQKFLLCKPIKTKILQKKSLQRWGILINRLSLFASGFIPSSINDEMNLIGSGGTWYSDRFNLFVNSHQSISSFGGFGSSPDDTFGSSNYGLPLYADVHHDPDYRGTAVAIPWHDRSEALARHWQKGVARLSHGNRKAVARQQEDSRTTAG